MVRARTLVAIAVVGTVVASGCLTMTTSTEVRRDGTIEKYTVELAMPQMILSQMKQEAQANGTTLEESIRSGYDEDNYGSVSVNVTLEEREGKTMGVITIVLTDFDPEDVRGSDFNIGTSDGEGPTTEGSGPQITVTTEGDRIVFEDGTYYNESALNQSDEDDVGGDLGSSFELTYELTMPGPIVESETNADEVDGNTATWERTGTDVFSATRIRAVAEINDPPEAAASAGTSNPSTGQDVEFSAADSSDPNGDELTYEWDFDGDGEVDATGETVTHAFEETGDHEVRLLVTDAHGATDEATATVSVGSGGQGLPGFGAGLAALALAVVVLATLARRR